MKPIDRARAYVAKMPPAISGQGGHNRTFHVACVLVQGFALGEDEAWPLLQEYNLRCDPEWSETELRHKLQDAQQAPSTKERGHLLHAPRIPFVPGLVRPARWTLPKAADAPQIPKCPPKVIPLDVVLGKEAHHEKLGTLGTLTTDSHVCSIHNLPSTSARLDSPAYPRGSKQSVPSVPDFPIFHPVHGTSQVQSQQGYLWPPPGTSEFDQETGHPIIDGSICPF